MATRPPVAIPKLSRRGRILLVIGGALLLALLLGSRAIGTYVDWLWYGEVDARNVFTTRLFTQTLLFIIVGGVVGGLVALSLWLAYRSRPVFVPIAAEEDPLARYRSTIVARARLFVIGIAVLVGLIAGSTAATEWEKVRLFFAGGDFGIEDPQFGLDAGFYVFQLPFYNWLLTWVFVILALAFIAAAVVHYLFGGIRLAGKGGQFTNAARIQLAVIAGLFVLFKAFDYFLDRYNLMLSDRADPLFHGATYTDLNALMPAKLIMMSIAIFCALAFFAGAVLRNLVLPAIALVLLLVSGLLVSTAWPAMLQQFSVKPNEISKEARSIERNMAATKYAYELTDDKVEFVDYGREPTVTADQAAADTATMPHVRLLDPGVLQRTFTQLEQRKNFYGFPEQLSIDRYTVDGDKGAYVIALREVNEAGLNPSQQGWIPKHLTFTHGNGFVAAPANQVRSEAGAQGRDPDFKVSDTSQQGLLEVEQPRVYYGELGADYAIVGSPQSGDYPGEYDSAAEDDRYYTYTGEGGISVDGFFHRLVFATHFQHRDILFSGVIGDGSKIMYNRDPKERVQNKAPWLTVDGDAYPAVVDGRIVWIVDGYTTTNDFPYSQRTSLGEAIETTRTGQQRLVDSRINYIRNSVKATVDAYDGTVTLYSMDDDEPILSAWREIFPGTVESESEISDDLRAHFRYPQDQFNVQRELLTRYHVEAPDTFYNNDARWDIPSDPTQEAEANQPPYYIMAADPRNPGDPEPQFQLTSVLNLLDRDFMAAFVSVSSEPDTYGQFTVRRLPGDTQTHGPQLVQAAFRGEDKVNEHINVLEMQSTVIFGNLLTLPVQDGLVYVEPVYVQRRGQESAYPRLNRVLVYHGEQVGYAPTLDAALEQVLGEGAGEAVPDAGEDVDLGDEDGQPPPDGEPDEGEEPPPDGEPEGFDAEFAAAAERLNEAYADGDLRGIAEAIEEMEEILARYNEAQGDEGN